MPQIALDCFYIIPIFDGDNSVLMAQIMKAQLRTAHLLDDPLVTFVHSPIRQKAALRVGKDKVALLPFRRGGFHEQLLLLLVLEQTNDGRRKGDCSALVVFLSKRSKERNTLLSEKKATPMLNILKHRELSRRIAELTEELEELRSEKKQLLAMMDYAEDTGLSTVKKDISAMETNLARLEQQEKKYTTELNAALAEYAELKTQASDFDPDELAVAQLEIRPQKEASAESRVRAAYGDKYDFWTMIGAKREVAELLGEEEPRSIREHLRRKEYEKQRTEKQELPQRKKNKDRGWER